VIKLFFAFPLLINSVLSNAYIEESWKICSTDSDCVVVEDMGCRNQCQTGVISKKYKKSLESKINSHCADVLTIMVTCAEDLRVKLPRCLSGKCKLMTKHICCTITNEYIHKKNHCDKKKVSCKEVPF
jgi:hypothetical protein